MSMFIRSTVFSFALAALLLLAGCTSLPGPGAQQATHDAVQEAATSKRGKPPRPPAAVSEALLPTFRAPETHADASPQAHFDVAVDDVPARAFFMGLVKDTRYNMVVPPGLKGRITLKLKDVTVPRVMHIVQLQYGYGYRRQGDVFMVRPQTLSTRIFHVDYLNIARKGVSNTRVASSTSASRGRRSSQSGARGGLYGSRDLGAGTEQSRRQYGTAIRTRVESKFWDDLKTALKAIVGAAKGRQVVVNADSGVIVIRALPSELQTVNRYLKQVQGIVSRQVILEAKIVEVVLNSGFQSGINWGALGSLGDNKSVFGAQIGSTGLFDLGRSDLAGVNYNVGSQKPVVNVPRLPASAFGGTFALALNLNDFAAFIELLETQGETHVLSSPRVATLNNQQAVIKVGANEFFVTGIRQNTFVSTTTASTNNVILQPFFSGIALDVTPQIDASGEVTLHIHPSVSEVTDQQKSFKVDGKVTSLPLALSQVREADSIVRARSNQIIVIGGLMKTESHDTQYKTPLLGDIPIVGKLFQHKLTKEQKTELVILLKPIVVDGPQTWADLGQDSFHRLKNIDPTGTP